FEAQCFSRALIEPQGDRVEEGLGEAREIGSSREVLSQQAVGVLVAAALPGTARIAEVNLHVCANREALLSRQLLALVPQRLCQISDQKLGAKRPRCWPHLKSGVSHGSCSCWSIQPCAEAFEAAGPTPTI